MKQKSLVLLDNTSKSLAFQHELLMNCHNWASNFDITFGYINLSSINSELISTSNEMNNNQYTYMEIVDKAFSNATHIDSAVLLSTKMMLQNKELKTILITDENSLFYTVKGFDLILLQHTCFGCKIQEWVMQQLVNLSSPSYITTDLNINEVKESYFLYTGSDDNTKALKQYIYLFDKSLDSQVLNLISIVNPSGMQHEKVVYDYIRSRFNKVMVQRVYIEDTPKFFEQILHMGKDYSIITHRNHNDFVKHFTNRSITRGTSVFANIFISQ
jgi:hypothetical protein